MDGEQNFFHLFSAGTRMNSKGMSPLATTAVLLIISILIGIVVMTWGRSYVEQATLPEVQKKEPAGENLLQELNDRLSRGEITQEQYDKIKEVLVKQS